MKILAISLLLLLVSSPALQAECKKLSAAEFEKLLKPEVKHVVFFASWCKSCEAHLTADYAKDSIFVATFDKAGAADQVMTKFFGAKAQELVCVFDEDEAISQRYKVKFLPFVATL